MAELSEYKITMVTLDSPPPIGSSTNTVFEPWYRQNSFTMSGARVSTVAVLDDDPNFEVPRYSTDLEQFLVSDTAFGPDLVAAGNRLSVFRGSIIKDADGNRFLADVQVAEAADQAEPVELAGALLETADKEHLLVEMEQLLLTGVVTPIFLERVLQRVEDEIAILGGRLRGGFLAPGGFGQDFGSLFFRGGIMVAPIGTASLVAQRRSACAYENPYGTQRFPREVSLRT